MNVSNIFEELSKRKRSMSAKGSSRDLINKGSTTKMLPSHDIAKMTEMCCYVRQFLAKPHPLVGRKGPVCPFVPKSLKLDSLYFGLVRTDGPTSKHLVERAARSFLTRYASLAPTDPKTEVFKAVVLLFPDVPIDKASDVIDAVQVLLKPEFVALGLMIGEFHKRNNTSGLRNPSFFPLRTPHPSLAIRRIVPTDLAFLAVDKYPAGLRVRFLVSYLAQFGKDGSAAAKKAKTEAEEQLKKARAELADLS